MNMMQEEDENLLTGTQAVIKAATELYLAAQKKGDTAWAKNGIVSPQFD